MEIKLFSKWLPSAILNLRKLPFWSSDRYLHVILHPYSEICINRPKWCRDISKQRFSTWRPSAILNLNNFVFFMRPSSVGGGRIVRRTLSVCLSVCPSVRLSVPCLHTYKNRSRVFVQPCGRAVSFVLFTFAGRIL